ncbi:MAG: hypothetical protein KDI74_06060 [Gammaproteobacteria bacterium]|nr:hypothetical protein [Gammaproteobacteria bacterium]HXK55035.1 hypothetical protein [Gammaproteobacteria bacterium]
MIRWKALFAGIAVVMLLGLLLQLAFTSIVVGQMEASRNFPEYSRAISTVPYLVGFGGYFLVMAVGGYVTASIARNQVVLNALIVGAVTAGISLWFSLDAVDIKPMSLVFFTLGLVFATTGALFWRVRQSQQ